MARRPVFPWMMFCETQRSRMRLRTGASDLLVDRIRRSVSPNKISVSQWRDVMEALHRQCMKSSAT
jgi:2-iminoacetate synthase ThiH